MSERLTIVPSYNASFALFGNRKRVPIGAPFCPLALAAFLHTASRERLRPQRDTWNGLQHPIQPSHHERNNEQTIELDTSRFQLYRLL